MFKQLDIVFLILIAIIVHAYKTVGVDLRYGRDFHITHWNLCLNSTELGFLTLYDKTQGDCVFECGIRTNCTAVIYKKIAQSCELLTNETTQNLSGQNGPCIYIEMNTVNKTAISYICNNTCSNEANCSNRNDLCSVKECEYLSVSNGKVSGNMITAGSILTLKCDDGYEPVGNNVSTTCEQPTRQWSPTLKCNKIPAIDCSDALAKGFGATSRTYNITLPISGTVKHVYCDMVTDGGGWNVFQNRFDGSVDFYRSFAEYVDGFGNIDGEFWLGLESVRELTTGVASDLRVQLTAADDTTATWTYDSFSLSEGPEYILHIGNAAGHNPSNTIGQWVTFIINFSSQWVEDAGWTAAEVIGEYDVYPTHDDVENAWSPLELTQQNQFLEVGFETAVMVTGIDIYETYHAGGIAKIMAKFNDPLTNIPYWYTLYTGVAMDITESRKFSPVLETVTQETRILRIEIDCSEQWRQIDAIYLHGTILGLAKNKGSAFSTFDNDVDASSGNCAVTNHGAWWYTDCTNTNLNGQYTTPGTNAGQEDVSFLPFRRFETLKATRLMFRRNSNG